MLVDSNPAWTTEEETLHYHLTHTQKRKKKKGNAVFSCIHGSMEIFLRHLQVPGWASRRSNCIRSVHILLCIRLVSCQGWSPGPLKYWASTLSLGYSLSLFKILFIYFETMYSKPALIPRPSYHPYSWDYFPNFCGTANSLRGWVCWALYHQLEIISNFKCLTQRKCM